MQNYDLIPRKATALMSASCPLLHLHYCDMTNQDSGGDRWLGNNLDRHQAEDSVCLLMIE